MTTVLIIIAAVAVPFLAYWLIRRRDPFRKRIEAALSSGRSVWTRYMVDVAHEAGTAPLDDAQIDAIDMGLLLTFNKARTRGWAKMLDHALFTVIILKGEKYKGVNCIRLPNGECVAGIVVDLKQCRIAVPEHGPDELEELARIVGYEAEHCILYANDRAEYERTKIHKTGEGHPIF